MLGGAVYVNGDQSRPSATVRELLKYISSVVTKCLLTSSLHNQ